MPGHEKSKSPAKEEDEVCQVKELSGEEMKGVQTLFRFPFGVVVVGVVAGCVAGDIFYDSMLVKDDLVQYYTTQAKVGPYGLVMSSLIALSTVIVLNFFRHGISFHNAASLLITAGLFAIRCTQLYPRISSILTYTQAGDPASLGRLPSALRGLYVFNIVQIPLLILIACLQMYNYALWVADGLAITQAAHKDKKE
eukprot:TRINITY_DN16495_c0_g1_i1.p1 TRINITY_DN16495_c0_g1~~TRINITY_DN16495_c0_g1_i1.p1  ORF type:complete len:196 (+),score=39.52 TRINITY_DN16495_c0_g1_i1:75-662(+)